MMVMVQAPMTGDWSQRKKISRTETFAVVHPFSRRAPFRESCSMAQRLDAFPSVLEGQFKVRHQKSEIVVGRVELKKVETFRTQTKAATVTSIKSWSSKLKYQIERQLHITARTTVDATGTGSVTHQPELLSVVLTTVVMVLTINR